MLIGLTGYIGAGKDSVGQVLIDKGYTRLAFGDAVREAVYRLNPIIDKRHDDWDGYDVTVKHLVDKHGWEHTKREHPEIRRLLMALGTEVARDMFGPDVWVNAIHRQVLTIDGDIVITDVRFANEVKYIHETGGVVWRITRPGFGLVSDHVSELNQKDIVPDFVLENDGSLKDLVWKTEELL